MNNIPAIVDDGAHRLLDEVIAKRIRMRTGRDGLLLRYREVSLEIEESVLLRLLNEPLPGGAA